MLRVQPLFVVLPQGFIWEQNCSSPCPAPALLCFSPCIGGLREEFLTRDLCSSHSPSGKARERCMQAWNLGASEIPRITGCNLKFPGLQAGIRNSQDYRLQSEIPRITGLQSSSTRAQCFCPACSQLAAALLRPWHFGISQVATGQGQK